MFHWFKCYSPIKCFILKNSTSPRIIIQQPGTFAMPSKYCFGSSWPNRNGHLNHGKAMAFDTQQKNPWHHGALSYHSQTHHIVGSITSYNVASVKHIPPSSKARFGVTDFETSRLRPFFFVEARDVSGCSSNKNSRPSLQTHRPRSWCAAWRRFLEVTRSDGEKMVRFRHF